MNKITEIGVDEVGRGAVFGPVFSAVVVLNKKDGLTLKQLGVRDSKKLSSVRPVDPSRLALMLPPQFRRRCTSTAVDDEIEWRNIELDMCDYVLKATSN